MELQPSLVLFAGSFAQDRIHHKAVCGTRARKVRVFCITTRCTSCAFDTAPVPSAAHALSYIDHYGNNPYEDQRR